VLSQLKIVIRTNYSNPPTFGAQVVATVLDTPALRAHVGARTRRHARAHQAPCARRWSRLQAAGVKRRPGLHHRQKGMFSYSGLSKEQMQRLRSEFGVYGLTRAASAWPPSTAATSTPWCRRSPR
jgi:aromatic-amino-acid transaminase